MELGSSTLSNACIIIIHHGTYQVSRTVSVCNFMFLLTFSDYSICWRCWMSAFFFPIPHIFVGWRPLPEYCFDPPCFPCPWSLNPFWSNPSWVIGWTFKGSLSSINLTMRHTWLLMGQGMFYFTSREDTLLRSEFHSNAFVSAIRFLNFSGK